MQQSLAPLGNSLPGHPLAFLGVIESNQTQMKRFPELLRELYDRNSRAAVLSSALGYELGLVQGRMHIADHLKDGIENDFKQIINYPDTEEARDAAGTFRAAVSTLFMSVDIETGSFKDNSKWVGQFWDAISGFGPCMILDTLKNETPDNEDPEGQFIYGFRNAVRSDLKARLTCMELNLNRVEAYEVTTALLCRQATLVMEMAISPGIWTAHTAPIILRAIADVFITLAWIIKDPDLRAKKFIEDGLGAMKLQIAHKKEALNSTNIPEEAEQIQQMIDNWSDWLKSQRLEVFVEVNLGSWSGLSTRKMAEESGFLDFYNHVYQPFSNVCHSNWAHVSMFNTLPCENPAHRSHRGAAIAPLTTDPQWILLASKYLSKTLAHFDEVHEIDLPHTAFDFAINFFDEMQSDHDTTMKEQD